MIECAIASLKAVLEEEPEEEGIYTADKMSKEKAVQENTAQENTDENS